MQRTAEVYRLAVAFSTASGLEHEILLVSCFVIIVAFDSRKGRTL